MWYVRLPTVWRLLKSLGKTKWVNLNSRFPGFCWSRLVCWSYFSKLFVYIFFTFFFFPVLISKAHSKPMLLMSKPWHAPFSPEIQFTWTLHFSAPLNISISFLLLCHATCSSKCQSYWWCVGLLCTEGRRPHSHTHSPRTPSAGWLVKGCGTWRLQDRQTDRQTDGQTDRWTDRHTDRQVSVLACPSRGQPLKGCSHLGARSHGAMDISPHFTSAPLRNFLNCSSQLTSWEK